jgi:hypothetical protein
MYNQIIKKKTLYFLCFTGTKTNGNYRVGAQQRIGKFDDSKRRIQVSFQKAQITKFRFEQRAFGRVKTTI